jgi:serine/threonine protein phosphatase PrpC
MNVEFNGVCDKGLKREINQDRLYMRAKNETVFFVVADGMGGHEHGERASQLITTKLREWYDAFDEGSYMGDFSKMVIDIKLVLEHANESVYNMYDKNTVCGSTVVVFFLYKDSYAVIWAGDSRAYILKHWQFKQLTVDDVWENQTNIKSNLTKKMIRESVNQGRLVNSIGVFEKANINVRTDKIKPGTKILLCSDGLYKMCPDKEIKKMMEQYNGSVNGDALMKEYLNNVYRHGAVDNVSFIVAVCN